MNNLLYLLLHIEPVDISDLIHFADFFVQNRHDIRNSGLHTFHVLIISILNKVGCRMIHIIKITEYFIKDLH